MLGITSKSWGALFEGVGRSYDKLCTAFLPSFPRAQFGLPPIALAFSPTPTPGLTPMSMVTPMNVSPMNTPGDYASSPKRMRLE